MSLVKSTNWLPKFNMTKTLSCRVKDKHAKLLNQFAFEVNQVWNKTNEIGKASSSPIISIDDKGETLKTYPKRKTEFDLINLLKGFKEERQLTLLGAATIQSVVSQYSKSRNQFKKDSLAWRHSGGKHKSLGWIPFKTDGIKYVNGQIRFCGYFFSLWDSYGLNNYDLQTGSFSQDSRGRWYFNTSVEISIGDEINAEYVTNKNEESIGIDLNLKVLAVTSNGDKFDNTKVTYRYADKLATFQRASTGKKEKKRTKLESDLKKLNKRLAFAQRDNKLPQVKDIESRILLVKSKLDVKKENIKKSDLKLGKNTASKDVVSKDVVSKETNPSGNSKKKKVKKTKGKKKQIRNLFAKIKNSRKHHCHVTTDFLTKNFGALFLGDIKSKSFTKTKAAKSVYDAGWGMLRTQLEYKAIMRSVLFVEVNERYTTQICSNCLEISDNSPKGRPGLRIREWTCPLCGVHHDRDVNAAKNILALGHERLAVGISVL